MTDNQQCEIPGCIRIAYYQCFDCERNICAQHTTRLPQWCQFHQDACPDCYEKLPEERKAVVEE